MTLSMVAESRGMIRVNLGNGSNLLSHAFVSETALLSGLRAFEPLTLYFRLANVDITHIFVPCELPVIVLRLLVGEL